MMGEALAWLRPGALPEAAVAAALGIAVAVAGVLLARRARALFHPLLLAGGQDRGHAVRLGLRGAAALLWAVALLGPAWGTKEVAGEERTRDVVLAVDMSRSMYAEDVPPSRLVRVREAVADLVRTHPGYRYALVLFAGDAWLRIPFTYDHDFLLNVLDRSEPAEFSPQGTDLRQPLQWAVKLAEQAQLSDAVAILITDGEHHGAGGVAELAGPLRQAGVHVAAVGVGEPGGAPIPGPDGDYLRERNGQRVISKPDLDLLRQLAGATDGAFLNLTTASMGNGTLTRLLDQVGTRSRGDAVQQRRVDRAVWPLGAGWLLLAMSLLPLTLLAVPRGRPAPGRPSSATGMGAPSRSSRGPTAAMALALAALAVGGCRADREAARDLEQGRHAEAAAWYGERAAETGDPRALHNLGTALYGQERYASALTAFAMAASRETVPERKAADLYDAGNAAVKAGKMEQAAKLYRAALAVTGDTDATYNRALIQRLLKRMQKQQRQAGNQGGSQARNQRQGRQEGEQEQARAQQAQARAGERQPDGEQGEQQPARTGDQPPEDAQRRQGQRAGQPRDGERPGDDRQQPGTAGDQPRDEPPPPDAERRPGAANTAGDGQDRGETEQDELGVLLRHRLEQLKEAEPNFQRKGSGDGDRPW